MLILRNFIQFFLIFLNFIKFFTFLSKYIFINFLTLFLRYFLCKKRRQKWPPFFGGRKTSKKGRKNGSVGPIVNFRSKNDVSLFPMRFFGVSNSPSGTLILRHFKWWKTTFFCIFIGCGRKKGSKKRHFLTCRKKGSIFDDFLTQK